MEHTQKIQKQFERQAEIYANMEQTQDSGGHELFVALCEVTKEHRVLDIACGPGFLTRQFAQSAKDVIGIDITNAFLKMATNLARKQALDNVTFTDGDGNNLPFDDDSFDIVACRAAFHHFPQPATVLAEMARVLKPEGTIAIGDLTTSEETEKANYQHEMEVLCDPSHARAITLGRFRKLITESGLEMKSDFQGTQDYDLQEWIAHGSPSTEAASRIEELMQRAISQDLCDLNVRREDGKIRFTHQTALFLATKVPGD